MSGDSALRGSAAGRPDDRVIGYQRWRDLLFVHWRANPAVVQQLLPAGLTVERFDGAAWIGLVPFAMRGVRPRWSPAVAGVSNFLETNVRTYVCHPNAGSGVWFFSLDATRRLAVAVARTLWHLNYRYARLQLSVEGQTARYASRGRTDGRGRYEIEAVVPLGVGPHAAEDCPQWLRAKPGTLDHFLLERYRLFASDRRGRLFAGRVFHPPYPYAPAELRRCDEQLTAANGVACAARPHHVVYSPGVDVEVFPLHRVDSRMARALRAAPALPAASA